MTSGQQAVDRRELERWLDEAAELSRREAHAAAAAHYRKILDALSHHPAFMRAAVGNNLGLALMRDAQLPEAEDAFTASLALHETVAAFVNLGNARRRMGNKSGATQAYSRATDIDEGCAPAWFNLHATTYAQDAPRVAQQHLERALALRPDHFETRFYYAALLALHAESTGDGTRADDMLAALPEICAFMTTSLRYVQRASDDATRLFADTFDTLAFALSAARLEGEVVELGVRRGTTLRWFARRCDPDIVHGFDAFEGLPEDWGDQAAGLYTTHGELPEVPANVELHPGWFEHTLPPWAQRADSLLRLVHVDCDLYTSTHTALQALKGRLAPGTVLVFDEYLCNPGWEQEEHRALVELDWPYRYLGFSLFTKQAVVMLL